MRRQRLLTAMLVLLGVYAGIASAGSLRPLVAQAFRPASRPPGSPKGLRYGYAEASQAGQNRSEKPTGVVHALLINGGSQPASNHPTHLQHRQQVAALL